MANWYLSRDGKTVGPYTAVQVKEFAANGKIRPSDHVRRDGWDRWFLASEIEGLLPKTTSPPPASPPTGTIDQVVSAVNKFLSAVPVTITKPSSAPPAPASAFSTPTAIPTAKAAPSATKSAPAPDATLPSSVALRPRSAPANRNSGEDVPDQFAACWNGLESVNLPAQDLLFFCATKTPNETSLTQTISGFFGKPAPKSYWHIALFRRELVLMRVDGTQLVCERYPLDQLRYVFSPAGEAGLLGMLASAQEKVDRKVTDKLEVSAGSTNRVVELWHSTGLERLKQTLAEACVARAEEHFAAGRLGRAEDILDRLTPDTPEVARRTTLREKIGTLARVEAEYRGGLDEQAATRGVLRFDSLGLEFTPVEGEPWRLALADMQRLAGPLRGQFPQEYVNSIRSRRQAAQAAVASAKMAKMGSAGWNKVGAAAGLMAAKSSLAQIQLGEPFANRIAVFAVVHGQRRRILFDVAGAGREQAEQATAQLVAALPESLRNPPLVEPVLPSSYAVVGCPNCNAKVRTRAPGEIRCPRCSTRLRVTVNLFRQQGART